MHSFINSFSLQEHLPADKNVTEFETIKYECKEGSKPLNTSDGKFELQCPNGAVWPSMAESDWPECEVHYCMIISDLDNGRTDDPGRCSKERRLLQIEHVNFLAARGVFTYISQPTSTFN